MGGTIFAAGEVGGRGLDALEDFKSGGKMRWRVEKDMTRMQRERRRLPFVGVDDGRGREEEAAPPETMGDAVTCKCFSVSRENEWRKSNGDQLAYM
jgi:hypothetical protein